MEDTLKGMSTIDEVVARIETRRFQIRHMSQTQQRNLITFADGSQATVTIQDGWTLRDRKDLWEGGAKA